MIGARAGIVMMCALLPLGASAQTVEIAPFAGYRVGGGFFERVTGQQVDLDGAPSFGGTLNVALHDGLWFEGLFTRQHARVTVPGAIGQPPTRWRIDVDHWMAGGRQDFGSGRARPFLTGLLGLTHYAAEGDNEVRFAISAGGGVTLHAARNLGVRFDGRVFTTFADLDGRAIACSPGICLFALDADVVWQGEFSAGLLIAF